jgi:hypothetical protein
MSTRAPGEINTSRRRDLARSYASDTHGGKARFTYTAGLLVPNVRCLVSSPATPNNARRSLLRRERDARDASQRRSRRTRQRASEGTNGRTDGRCTAPSLGTLSLGGVMVAAGSHSPPTVFPT